jgi:hypothetical protein
VDDSGFWRALGSGRSAQWKWYGNGYYESRVEKKSSLCARQAVRDSYYLLAAL